MSCHQPIHHWVAVFILLLTHKAIIGFTLPVDIFYRGNTQTQSGDDHQMSRERRTEEQVQLLPESGLARRHAATSYLGLGKPSSLNLLDRDTSRPEKRSALMLDKLMFALEKAVNEEKAKNKSGVDTTQAQTRTPSTHVSTTAANFNNAGFSGSGLERRGNSHGKVYWRCYFNAVSCF